MKQKLASALVAAIAAATLCSPPASASPAQDDVFWDILVANDIIPGPQAVQNAYRICHMVWGTGATVWDAVERVYRDNNVTKHEAEIFVVTAIRVYCPPPKSSVT